MANYFKYYADLMWTRHGLATVDYNNAQIDLNSAWAYWAVPDDHSAIQKTMQALQHVLDAGVKTISTSDPPFYDLGIVMTMLMSWEYTTEDIPEVTYKSIAEAWLKDDFKGRAVTIAFIDRMRQLLWDEPFSATFSAKPEEQEIPD
ncbi:unnamed protein product [marine sediment metagenome]|uniref:Uncharacterized protein n=1 Tax=marine sediment metagenome TaxID=412755 RepID=X1JMF4_9ZZZZ